MEASTSRKAVDASLTREEKSALEVLRRSPDLFAFLSFQSAWGDALALPPCTAAELGACTRGRARARRACGAAERRHGGGGTALQARREQTTNSCREKAQTQPG
jgi:hypothetical protein